MQSERTTTASSSIQDLSQEILKKDDLRVQTQYDCIQRYKNDHQLSSNSTKIFVGGLPADLTVDEFRDYFQKFGSMEDVVVMSDKETSRPRGFGFVTFESPETAEKVLKNRFYELKNKRVEVKKAVSKERMSRNFGNYYDTYNAFYNGTTFPFAASSSYGNFGGGYNYNYNYGMNGYGYGASYGSEGLSYVYYPYQSYTSTYYANNYQNLSYYADTYSYQSPCFYGNTPYSSKHTNKYKNRTLNVVKDGGGDSNVTIKSTSLVQKKFEDLHLGSDGEKNGDGDGDGDGDGTEISEGLRLDCNGGGGGDGGCGGGDGTEISEGLRLDCNGGGGGDSGCGGGDGTEISEGLRLGCNGGGGGDSGCGGGDGGCAVVIDQDLSL